MKRKGIFVPTQQLEASLQTARSTAVRHTLGIHMLSRNQIQADPAAEHTHDGLLGRREKVTVRAGLATLCAYHSSNHVGCLTVTGSLTYHTVWSQSGRSSTRVMPIVRASMSVLPGARARRAALLTCAPETPLCCGLLCCALYDASCSVGLLHKTYAAAPTQPISFAIAAPQAAALPSPSDPFLPFLPRESTPDARN